MAAGWTIGMVAVAFLAAWAAGVVMTMMTSNDFEGAFARIAQQRPDFIYVLQDALTLQNRRRIIDFANLNRLPSMFVGKEWVEEGGLMCYGDRLPERYRRAVSYVDKILGPFPDFTGKDAMGRAAMTSRPSANY